MLLVYITLLIAIVGFIFAILAFTKKPDKYLEQHYKTKPLNITVQNADNATNAQHCTIAENINVHPDQKNPPTYEGIKNGPVSGKALCQCPITTQKGGGADQYFTVTQPSFDGPGAYSLTNSQPPMLKYGGGAQNSPSRGAYTWQVFPTVDGTSHGIFN